VWEKRHKHLHWAFKMKTYAQWHRWTNVSCQEHSLLFLHLFTTLSTTQISWRATVVFWQVSWKASRCVMCCSIETGCRVQNCLLQYHYYRIWHVLGSNIQAINTSVFHIKWDFIACNYRLFQYQFVYER
jgi:hypothetical protein